MGTLSAPMAQTTGIGGTPSTQTFTIDAPDVATEGTSEPDSPTATSASRPAAAADGTVFPLLQSTLSFGDGGISADVATNRAGATITVLRRDGDAREFRLQIPALGIDTVFTSSDLFVRGATVDGVGRGGVRFSLLADGLDYVHFGKWLVRGAARDLPSNGGFFVTGYRTPPDAVPRRGTAAYNGRASGLVLVPEGGGYQSAVLAGQAALTADFSARTLDGRLTNMTATGADTVRGTWNDVTIDANFAATSGAFRGTTGAEPTRATPFALDRSAAGHIAGALFGPSGEELGAVWSLSDGRGAAVGVIGAAQVPARPAP